MDSTDPHFLAASFLGVSCVDMIHLPARYTLVAVTAAPRVATTIMCLDKCFPPGCSIRGILHAKQLKC